MSNKPRSAAGRPHADESALMADRIVAAATTRFLRDGYAATSMEAIAASAGLSKRALYARYSDKGAVFAAVVTLFVRGWLEQAEEALAGAAGLEDALLRFARATLDAALSPTALSLHALIHAQSLQVPVLRAALPAGSLELGTGRVAGLLHAHAPQLSAEQAQFAAQQFQSMIVAVQQRQALMTGQPPSAAERAAWCRRTVDLLMQGLLPIPVAQAA